MAQWLKNSALDKQPSNPRAATQEANLLSQESTAGDESGSAWLGSARPLPVCQPGSGCKALCTGTFLKIESCLAIVWQSVTENMSNKFLKAADNARRELILGVGLTRTILNRHKCSHFQGRPAEFQHVPMVTTMASQLAQSHLLLPVFYMNSVRKHHQR